MPVNVETPATVRLPIPATPSTSKLSVSVLPVTVTPVLDVTNLTVLLAPYNFTVSLLVTSKPASLPTALI